MALPAQACSGGRSAGDADLSHPCGFGALPDHDLSRIDGVTGEPLSRYEHDHPGSLLHVDVTKFVNVPYGGVALRRQAAG